MQTSLSRREFLIFATGGTAALLAGCRGGAGTGEVSRKYTGPALTLSYWNGFTADDGGTMRELVDAFNKAHHNITVKNNTYLWSDFYRNLPHAVHAGNGPDLGVMHVDHLATYAASGIIVPLDGVTEAVNVKESDFTPQLWQLGIYNGSRYGIPLDVHCLAMYYNKSHFKKAGIAQPPADAAEFEEACRKLKAAGFNEPNWIPNQWPAIQIFLNILWQNGGEPFNPDGTEATYDSEEGVAALTWMLGQIDNGYSPEYVAGGAQWTAFKSGKNSIELNGIWQIREAEQSGLDYGLAPIPTLGDSPALWANSHHFFMTDKAAKDKNRSDASTVFFTWISQRSGDWARAGMIPARSSARTSSTFTSSRQYALKDHLDKLHFLPAVPGLPGVSTRTLGVGVNEGILQKRSPQDVLTAAAERATQLLDANKERFGS